MTAERTISLNQGPRVGLESDLRETEYSLATAQQTHPDTVESHETELQIGHRITEILNRLGKLNSHEYRQLLHREGDRLGRLLAWLLRRERLLHLIFSLKRADATRVTTKSGILLTEHLKAVNTKGGNAQIPEIQWYLATLDLPRLSKVQQESLDDGLQLEDLREEIGELARYKTPGPDSCQWNITRPMGIN
ncbi:hypothetical protein NDU88_007322 [Pleurodeles waltl]|uniref:Uncharacterized protein n=1 Tax=Pleurodeles waltl TaxID=8319 RepID=A0AAV7TZP3_PLEWA|nr:hypothetical protein NDU88_007322 [Pleurodeles waltl]